MAVLPPSVCEKNTKTKINAPTIRRYIIPICILNVMHVVPTVMCTQLPPHTIQIHVLIRNDRVVVREDELTLNR